MGKNNRARRSAKQKARQQSNRPNRRGQLDDVLGTPPSLRELVDDGWHQVALASMRDEPIVPVLVVLAELPRRDVDLGAERALMSQVARLWLGGWQPAELVRQTARTVGSSTSRMLVSSAIAADHLGRSPAGLDDRWQQQLDDLRLPELGSRSGWIRRIVDDEPTRRAQLEVIADAIVAICALPRLDTLIPPPGADPSSIWPPGGGTVSPTGPVDPTIERVRNLLAKAESTEFDAEAAAFTAKAQELIVRHAIDRALLAHHAGSDPSDRPVAVRVFVDAPYADAKSFLLQIIADESRCRSVFHAGLDMSTVVGFPSDVGPCSCCSHHSSYRLRPRSTKRRRALPRALGHEANRSVRRSTWRSPVASAIALQRHPKSRPKPRLPNSAAPSSRCSPTAATRSTTSSTDASTTSVRAGSGAATTPPGGRAASLPPIGPRCTTATSLQRRRPPHRRPPNSAADVSARLDGATISQRVDLTMRPTARPPARPSDVATLLAWT